MSAAAWVHVPGGGDGLVRSLRAALATCRTRLAVASVWSAGRRRRRGPSPDLSTATGGSRVHARAVHVAAGRCGVAISSMDDARAVR